MKLRRLLLLPLIISSAASQTAPAPNLHKYRAPRFHVSTRKYTHGKLTIAITQIRNTSPRSDEGYCDAWFEVRSAGKVIDRRAFMNIEPVGGDFGLFVLKPLKDGLFAVGKAGDYADFTLLTDRTGKTLQVPGRPQFVVGGIAFLEESIAEEGRVTVVDLTRLKMLYSRPAEGEIAHWYLTASGVLFTLLPDERQPHPPAFIWNTQKRTFMLTTPPASLPRPAERFPVWHLSPQGEECGSRQSQ